LKLLDRILQRWRISKVRPFLPPGTRVLDIGSADGTMFKHLSQLAPDSLGIDPTLKTETYVGGRRLLPGFFPQDMPAVKPFDAVTILAVLEHFPETAYGPLRFGCAQFLRPGGRVIITVPSPAVDRILEVLKALRLVDGMSLEEHHGFEVRQVWEIFGAPEFKMVCHRRFQLGLNHLFVFERCV
jgi:SAM-dependent methyltransferase